MTVRLVAMLLACAALAGCAVGQKFSYADGHIALLANRSDTPTAVAVLDQRPYILSRDKRENFVGLSRGGITRLDALAGQVSTRGKAVDLTNLVATSGKLAAGGNVSISPSQALSGRITVDLSTGKGDVGVPLVVGGTLDDPSVTLTRSAMVGAALGTLVMPGPGTAAGASTGGQIGESLRNLFGGGKKK